MTLEVLKVAVVGHTNTGKTSLLRTLTRDVAFGEVSNRPATTRDVEAVMLMVDGEPAIELFDTPGLEDSSGLLERLDELRQRQGVDWTDAIGLFLESEKEQVGFGQEAKVLRRVIDCDVALYVIDARDRIHGKHKDELEILGRCARPILPVLNFVAAPDADPEAWRAHLARVNMHAVVAFDTVVLDETSESRLYQKMATLLDGFAPTLEAVLADVTRRQEDLKHASAELIADLVIDVAAYRMVVPARESAELETALEDLREAVRGAEQTCVDRLIDLYRFRPGDYLSETLPIEEGRWGRDLFDPGALADFGITTGGAAASGALAGLAIDVVVGGMTLGAAALTGAAIGALTGAIGSRGRQVLDLLRGYSELRANTATLELLTRRELALCRALQRRGHASQERLRLADRDAQEDLAGVIHELKKAVETARLHPEWSRLDRGGLGAMDSDRQELRRSLAKALRGALGA